MKRVINGKVYNTETAEKVGTNDCGYYPGDFNYEDTDLYKTSKGAFFLAGKGGALSRWAEFCGNGRSGGSGVQALTEAEALEWCEQNRIGVDVIADHFKVDEA